MCVRTTDDREIDGAYSILVAVQKSVRKRLVVTAKRGRPCHQRLLMGVPKQDIPPG